MEDEIRLYIEMAKESMEHAIDHLHTELAKIRTGKANPQILSGIMVDYYGVKTPLNQTSNVSTSDSKTIVIQPFDKSMLQNVERAIFEANIGLTPQNDGELIRINIPVLTEERRKEYAKMARSIGEDSKVGLRSARHKAIEEIRKAVKDGYSEDLGKRRETEINNLTQKFGDQIDKEVTAKENELMTI